MLNALWQFIFPPKRQPEPPPLQRPRKYPRTGDARSSGQYGDAQENERFRGSDFAPGLQMQPHPAPLQSERPAFPAGSNQNSMNTQGFYTPGINFSRHCKMISSRLQVSIRIFRFLIFRQDTRRSGALILIPGTRD